MSPDQCNRCRFWRETDGRDPNDDDWSFGRCRRKPPVIVDALVAAIMPMPAFGQHVDPEMDACSFTPASLFPATHSTDWCGEFAPSVDAEMSR